MATLHLINRPSALASCLETARDEDTVLLLEDGVYAAAASDVDRPVRAIDVDVEARGLSARLQRNVTLASYEDFVRLVEEHQPIVSWR